jgi:deoxyribonuclease-4
MRNIGAHVSAAGGLDKTVERAAAIGANCMQVFSGSPRVWNRAPLSNINTDKLFSKQQELSISSIITHALYLTNLASDNHGLVAKSIAALTYDLQFDALVKGSGVVVHMGSHQGRGWETVKEQVAKALKEILSQTPAESHFLMENAASLNGKLGGNLDELKWLLDTVNSPRLGWCLDTCHAHAAGYHLGKPTSEHPSQTERFLVSEIERLDLWSALKCVHVNDSHDPFGSGRDRHANLGDGQLDQAELKYLLNLPQLKDVPLILEVPGLDDQGPDAENIRRLKTLVGEK